MDYYALLFFRYLKSKGSKGLRMIYNAFKGGTEQLLPVNTDTPSTSPLIADIQYTDELRENQEFTYRECPITVDGKAKLKSIKGNTIVWNQLQKATANTSTVNGITYTNNGDGSWSVSGTATASAQKALTISADWITAISGHKYLMVGGLPNGGSSKWLMQLYKNNANTLVGTDSGNGLIYTADDTTVNLSIYFTVYNGNTVNGRIYPQIFDLTKMGLDSITSVSEFTLLFPLPYYSYESGKLLSFNGTGLETTGKNLLSYDGSSLPYNANNVSITRNNDVYEVVASGATGYPFARICTIPYLAKGQYTITMLGAESSNTGIAWRLIDRNTSPVKTIVNSSDTSTTFNLTEDVHNVYFEITIDATRLTTGSFDVRFMLAFGTDNNYEPYTTSTTTIPTDTYFPTGMKSAGSVYDELTNSKAITRIGEVDLGTLTWQRVTSYTNPFFAAQVEGRKTGGAIGGNYVCALYNKNLEYRNSSTFGPNASNMDIAFSADTNSTYIYVKNDSYSDATTFKTAMDGVMLQYELAEEVVVDVDQSDTNQLLNSALSTIMGRNVTSNNPQLVLDVLTKGE